MSSQGNKYLVNITQSAIANIKEIMDFYIDAMNYPPAAKEFREAVYEKLRLIADNLPNLAELGYHKTPVYIWLSTPIKLLK